MTRSENANPVILTYENNLYRVDRVNVQYSEGKNMYEAVFRAKGLYDCQPFELNFEISPDIYQVLVDYTKLDNSNLLLVFHFESNVVKWRLVSETWLRQQIKNKANRYVV